MKQKLALSARILFLGIGVAMLALLIRGIGWQNIVADAGRIGWRFVPIMGISFAWYLLYTFAWEQFLKRMSVGIRFWELLRIKLAGEAVNTLTPAGFIGGDPLRIYLLKHHLPMTEGAASVVVDRTLHSMATLLVVIAGIAVAFLTMDHLSANLTYGIPIVLLIATIFVTFIFLHQQRGMFGLILSLCQRMGIKREFSENTIARFSELDQHIIDFYSTNRRGFAIALSCHVLGRLLGIVEIYVIGKAVSSEFSLFAALILTALTPAINVLFAFVPGALGVMEGAYSAVLYLLHVNPSIGLTIQIARRLRAAAWIAIGLLCLGRKHRHKAWKEDLIDEV